MRLLSGLLLLTLASCDLARGDVTAINGSDEPVRFAVAYGRDGWQRLPSPDSVHALRPLAPTGEVRIGRALALADSGGVTVAFYSIPDTSGAQSQIMQTDAAGAAYLREATGDTVFRID